MKIKLTSVFVDDQDKAIKFYTQIAGFVMKRDIPAGQYRWLTVVSPQDPEGTELLLEPNDNPAARAYQKVIHDQGIPATTFGSDNVREEYGRMKNLGVKFTMEPTLRDYGGIDAVFDDTCGNLIGLHQEPRPGRMSPKETAVSFLRSIIANRIEEAFMRYIAQKAISHNPFIGGTRESLMMAMKESANVHPHKIIDIQHALSENDMVVVHSHIRMNSDDRGTATVHIFRFDNEGKISEIWDIGQQVPENSPNANGMF